VGAARSTVRYRRQAGGDDGALRERLRELAAQRPRFGYRRLHALLRREGIVVNHKRVARIYRAEGLPVRRRKRKTLAPIRRGRPPAPERANAQWALDFVEDALASGRKIRLLSIIDVFTREALSLEVDTSLPGRAESTNRNICTWLRGRYPGQIFPSCLQPIPPYFSSC
jgi:putative transposase